MSSSDANAKVIDGATIAPAKARQAYGWDNPRPLPTEFPFYTVDDVDAVFSTAGGYLHNGGRYLSYQDGQCGLVSRQWQSVANSLFFQGGKLADHGIKPCPEIDPAALRKTLHYLLSSWGPKHEEKAATVGFALMHWCEPIDASGADGQGPIAARTADDASGSASQ